MKNNKKNNSNIELILDKVNGEYVLVNKKDVENAIELKINLMKNCYQESKVN